MGRLLAARVLARFPLFRYRTLFLRRIVFNRHACVLLAIGCLWAIGVEWSSPPQQPTTWGCDIRCIESKIGSANERNYLDARVQNFLVCAQYATDLRPIADQQCAQMYAHQVAPGWKIEAEFGTPLAPDSLVSCQNKGTKCDKPGVVSSMWQCPAHCKTAESDYPTTFDYCGISGAYALKGGLSFYASGTAHSLCESGELLQYDPPSDVECVNVLKSCPN